MIIIFTVIYLLQPNFTILFTSERCNANFRPAFLASKRGSKKSFAFPTLKIKVKMKMHENSRQTDGKEKNGRSTHLKISFVKHLQCARHFREYKVRKDTIPTLMNVKSHISEPKVIQPY